MSWHHARLTPLPDGRAILEDLDSTNGTFVNGQRVRDRIFLVGGEVVAMGDTRLTAVAVGPPPVAVGPPPVAAGPPAVAAGPAAPVAAGPPAIEQRVSSPSVIQRIRLERSVRRANMAAVAALALSIIVIAVVVGAFVFAPRPTAPPAVTQGPPASAPLSVADVAAAAEPSTVIVVALRGGTRAGNGSGWLYDASSGYVVTNAHVVNVGETFQIGVDNMRSVDIVGVAPCEDLAVLRASDTSGLRTLPLGSQSQIRLGDTAIALGYPINASPTDDLQVTVGNVSAVKISYDPGSAADVPAYPNVVQTTAAINPGNSGGPLIDLAGQLIGVNSAKPPLNVEQTNYAIGVDRVKEIVPTLANGQSMTWTGLGFDDYITGARLTDPSTVSALNKLGLPVMTGIFVNHVAAGTPNPGFSLPALVVKADGTDLTGTLSDYCSAIAGKSASSVQLTVYEANAIQPLEVDVVYR